MAASDLGFGVFVGIDHGDGQVDFRPGQIGQGRQHVLDASDDEADRQPDEGHVDRQAQHRRNPAGVEDADEVLEQFADVSDETFDSIVALVAEKMKKKGEFPPQKKDEDKEDDDKDEKARKEAKKDKASEATDETISEEQYEAEADTETLEEVEEVAEAALSDCAEDDSVVSARSAASAWLETNVLRSTANITE